jgi:hypothetical protein
MSEIPAKRKAKLSDDAVDGIVAICLIAMVVTAVSIWLQNMT